MSSCYQCNYMIMAQGIAYCNKHDCRTALYTPSCACFWPIFPEENKRGISTGKVAQCNNKASIPKNGKKLQGRGGGCVNSCTLLGGRP